MATATANQSVKFLDEIIKSFEDDDKAKPVSLDEFTSNQSDASHLEDADEASAVLADYLKSIDGWIISWRSNREMTRTLAKLEVRLREMVVLSSGKPDWAGKSQVWKLGYKPFISAIYKRNGMTDKEIADLENAIMVQRSRTGATVLAIAEAHVFADNRLGTTKVVVKKATKNSPAVEKTVAEIVEIASANPDKNFTIPQVLKSAMASDYKAQVNTGGPNKGKPATGFEKVPSEFGPKRRGGGSTGRRPSAKANTPSAHWTQLAADLKKLAPESSAVELHKLATDFAKLLKGFEKDYAKTDASDTIGTVGTLLGLLSGAVIGKTDWAKVEKHYYTAK